MDVLLRDIKHFLLKLENGQMEIEAGQWELHKDLEHMKKFFDEMKLLKNEVEEMRICNAEQTDIIKKLEAKFEVFKNKCKKEKGKTDGENLNGELKKNGRRPADLNAMLPKGYKKRKSHHVHSEEIIEITPKEDRDVSATENSEKEDADEDRNTQEDTDKNDSEEVTESDSFSLVYVRHAHGCGDQTEDRKGNNEMLQRYLKDSAKFRDQRTKSTEETVVVSSNSAHDTVEEDDSHHDAWGSFSGRNSQAETYKCSKMEQKSVESLESRESLLPKKTASSKCSEQFMLKPKLSKRKGHELEKKNRKKGQKESFCTQKSSKTIKEMHKKHSGAYKCAYCSKACKNSKSLTLHMRKCRIILRSRFNNK